MNIIPTTFKNINTSYTIMGGKKTGRIQKYLYPVTFIILNRRGKFYREKLINEIYTKSNAEILYIVSGASVYSLDALVKKYPDIRVVLIKERVNEGERINIAIDEARSRFCFVLWDDMMLPSVSNIFKRVNQKDSLDALCIVPLLKTKKLDTVPSIMVPGFMKKELKVFNWLPTKNGMLTIFPFDFCGLYDKEKFLLFGGFDFTFNNPYWQKLDFGFRTYMWGEQITCDTSILVNYLEDPIGEDNTPDESYKYFYLKNIAVRFKRDIGVLPLSKLFPYIFKSDTGPLYAIHEFNKVRKWVRINRYRFKQDILRVVDLWDISE